MANRKQEGGQDFCKCNHKEFHHQKDSDGLNVCCMSNCNCEKFELRKEEKNE